jgi:DNA modification methylase
MNGEKFWLSSFECCVFGRKSNAYFSEHCASPIWRGPVQREQVHPTQKPLWLIETLVKASTPPNGVCLDFCCGSGTTLIAAVRHGRRAIGIELYAHHFDTAVARLESEIARTALLEPAPKIVQRTLLD